MLVAVLDLATEGLEVVEIDELVRRAGKDPMEVELNVCKGKIRIRQFPEVDFPHSFPFPCKGGVKQGFAIAAE